MSSKVIVALEAMTVNLDLLDAAAKRRGHHLVVLAGEPSMYLPDGRDVDLRRCDTFSTEAVRQSLQELGEEVIALFSPTDTWGIQAVSWCEELGLPHLMSAEKLEQLRDKEWVRSTTDQAIGTSGERARAGAHILKPRRGTGSQGISLFPTLQQLQEFFAAEGLNDADWVIEPYFRGPVFSAETYTRNGETTLLGVTNRIMSAEPVFVELVKSFPHLHDTPWEREAGEWAARILRSVDFTDGFAHIEFCETGAGLELIELNARMPGALIGPAIEQTTGIDIYDILIADALGEEPRPLTREVSGGHSHVSLYAENTGTVAAIKGAELLAELPGNVGWLPAKQIGARIGQLGDYKSRLGNVFATAFEPSLAQDYALAASRLIRVTVTGD